MSRDYLVHHGILGQKWGVRRYQNKDGSLTPAGQKRYYGEQASYYENNRYKRSAQGDQNYSDVNSGYNRYIERLMVNGAKDDSESYKKHSESLKKIFDNDDMLHDIRNNYQEVDALFKDSLKMRGPTDRDKEWTRLVKVFNNARSDIGEKYIDNVMNLGLDYVKKLPQKDQDDAKAFIWHYLGLDW